MGERTRPRRSLWMFGAESEEPSYQQRAARAAQLSQQLGVELTAPRIPPADALDLRAPRVTPPDHLAAFCFTSTWERAYHSYGSERSIYGVRGDYPNPPDVVAHPRAEAEVEAVLSWCSDKGYCAIPYGGGSSVVGGVTPPDGAGAIVTIALDELDQVLEVDEISRAALIQAGAFGPHLEDQLRPRGYTLRHFPQSFSGSTLGGWIATRSGGHYATNHTHIDEFVETVRMLTPAGWWEARRLPASGAGPDPNRLAIGSEGILGIITSAWMRIQARPRFRATGGIRFPTWEAGYEATRHIAQARLWPANLRLLDPALAAGGAGLDGTQAVLIVGFESAELPQRALLEQAVGIARDNGGIIPEDELLADDGTGQPTGRSGAAGAWRNAFIPSNPGTDRWPRPDRRHVRDRHHLGPLARVRRRRPRGRSRRARTELRRRDRELPVHPRVHRRPGTVLHVRRRLPRRFRPRRYPGGDQDGRVRRGHGRRRHHHPPPCRRAAAPPLVRHRAARAVRPGAASGKESTRPGRRPQPRRAHRPLRSRCSRPWASCHPAPRADRKRGPFPRRALMALKFGSRPGSGFRISDSRLRVKPGFPALGPVAGHQQRVPVREMVSGSAAQPARPVACRASLFRLAGWSAAAGCRRQHPPKTAATCASGRRTCQQRR